MRAAVFKGKDGLVLKEVPTPKIKRNDQVLLKVIAASICGTDVHILEVPPGHPATSGVILGHEYMGEVIAKGKAVKHLKVGDHVVVDPNITCGTCQYCQIGLPNMCEKMTTLGIFIDGGFAEYNVAPAKQLFKISKEVNPAMAAFAEPLSCVVNGWQKLNFQPGQSVVVLGAGPIGLLFTYLAKIGGAGEVIVSEPNSYRRGFVDKFGATAINPNKKNLEKMVLRKTVLGADVVIDAVGILLEDALSLVRRGGKVLLFGMNSKAKTEIRQNEITRSEIQILGTYIANHTFPAVVQMLESGIFDDLKYLISYQFLLEEIQDGIQLMKKGKAIKIIICPGV